MKKIYVLAAMLFISISASAQVVISQVYGGGGNSGAPYNQDFVELYNKSTTTVSLGGMSLQYASSTSTTGNWTKVDLPTVDILPGKYYLIATGTASTTIGVALPTPDHTIASISMSATKGKIALINSTTANNTQCPINIVDFVGFGTANCSENTPTPALSNTTAALRLNNGCTDSGNNSTDFQVLTPAPRNSATAANTCSTAPSLSIVSPANASSIAPEANVTITLSVTNFVVGNPGAGINGHIHYALSPGGTVVMKYDTTPIVLTGLAPGTYTLAVGLVDNNHQPLSPLVGSTVSFTIEPLNTVANLAALRADVTANGVGKYYQISSSPVVTYARPSAGRNQIYIQDASAGILIDDVPNVLVTNAVIGDALSGIKGRTSLFNGLLQLNPISDATVASSGNVVTPQVVTASAISANIEMYESELVQINNVTFPNATTFAVSTNYTINDGTDVVLRTLFSESNYITTATPATAVNMICLVGENNAVAQVTPRTSADFLPLSNSQFEIDGFSTYPNPVSNGVLNIITSLNDTKTVEIFDISGKQVFNKTISSQEVNIGSLKTGVYMLKVTENDKTSTQKLMVK